MLNQSKLQYPYLGIDIGCLAAGLTLLSDDERIIFQAYTRHLGDPAKTLAAMLRKHVAGKVASIVHTGVAGGGLPIPGIRVDPVVAGLEGARHCLPEARNVLSIGGGSFSLIEVDAGGGYRRSTLNSACASGTGAFLDQQALRLQIQPEELSLRARHWTGEPPPVATRCAVFAKSDMIHLQQEGYTIDAIAAGLCAGLGRSTIEGLIGGRRLEGLTVVIGGVALNTVVVDAIRHALPDVTVEVPENPHTIGSLGAAILARRNGQNETFDINTLIANLDHPENCARTNNTPVRMRASLELSLSTYPDFTWADRWEDAEGNETAIVEQRTGTHDAVMGIDIGSTSTKAALLDSSDKVIGWVYRKTAGDPIRAVQRMFLALRDMQSRGGFSLRIRGVGATGSGRKMIGKLIGADLALNEISAHATAALFLDPNVDTIIELGGQDAKFTQLQNGMVYNSVMNHVCAAGTGSFIEEQAQKLGIPLDAFADTAMCAQAPQTSDRCTVYMERDLDLLLARGYSKAQVAAAVLHSVRDNYLNKVVGGLQIGSHVYFQGATARNRALVAAFEAGLGKPIRVSRFCHLTGALGMALMVRNRVPENRRSEHFRGLEFADMPVRIEQERCNLCRNACLLSIIHADNETVAWGLKCGRDYASRQARASVAPGFDAWRRRTSAWRGEQKGMRDGHPPFWRVGLPRALGTYGYYPYWRAFLNALGCEAVLPPVTDEGTLREGTAIATAEYCAPVVVGHGHAKKLLSDETIDWLLVPHMIGEKPPPGFTNAHFCSYVQAHPAVLKSLHGLNRKERILAPVVNFDVSAAVQEAQFLNSLGKPLGVGKREIRRAMQCGQEAQSKFAATAHELGQAVMEDVEKRAGLGIVCVGRPYNTTDSGLNLDLPRKMAGMGYPVLYMDMLPLDPNEILPAYANMYWHYGQRILAAAEFIARSPCWFGVFFSNFMCGPDSYLLTYFKNIMGRAAKPYLCLQLDGHGADAGYLTRIEAALETFHAWAGIPMPSIDDSPIANASTQVADA